MKNCDLQAPEKITDNEYRFDSFENGRVLLGKKKNHLPAMGWNSWNAFGSGNTEALTKAMAERIVALGLDKLGYRYLVLDDGCYLSERVDGKLANVPEKFPSGFRALADSLHAMGLKFGMYNDIGTNLCAGAAVGTCGHEAEDAASYVEWDVDFLKVDNCYYLWDNATFSAPENAKYVYAPAIAAVTIAGQTFAAGKSISAIGSGIQTEEIDGKTYFTNIGTFDGTGPAQTPVGAESGELFVDVVAEESGDYSLTLDCLCKEESGKGSWLQVAIGDGDDLKMFYDDLYEGQELTVTLQKGTNRIRLMNHRRQENTLSSYAKLLEGLNEANPNHDIIYSMCEWGKTQPQNWAKKVGDSWRILNDISFAVGSDGDPGRGDWEAEYTSSITTQYNKCVIMDEFAGLEKGWNDPDMMVIGMNNLNMTQYRTHMAMWCMMNSPLMLGFDLRRVEKDDELYRIIANEELIALNQDALGVQAKRVYCSLLVDGFDTTYVTNNDRVDILAKPLSDGGVAVSFINLSTAVKTDRYQISADAILKAIGEKMTPEGKTLWETASAFSVTDLWTGEHSRSLEDVFGIDGLEACDNVTFKIVPLA